MSSPKLTPWKEYLLWKSSWYRNYIKTPYRSELKGSLEWLNNYPERPDELPTLTPAHIEKLLDWSGAY